MAELAQKEGIAFFEVSAKTDENIKNTFYNVVANLPSFAEANTNKEALIKELLQENNVENIQEGVNINSASNVPANQMNINGVQQPITHQTGKKRKSYRLFN